MKAAGAEHDGIPCMIFDEIDTGISGHVAEAVAEKMASIGRYHQVLCVTHLAQIAAMADAQYLVQKEVLQGTYPHNGAPPGRGRTRGGGGPADRRDRKPAGKRNGPCARASSCGPKMEKRRIKRAGNSKKPFPIRQNVLYLCMA